MPKEDSAFTKKEANELSKELSNTFINGRIPKFYHIYAQPVDKDNTMFTINCDIEMGDSVHDHQYFQEKTSEFFDSKEIPILMYEPEELKGEPDEDNIYDTTYVIQKPGERVYDYTEVQNMLKEKFNNIK